MTIILIYLILTMVLWFFGFLGNFRKVLAKAQDFYINLITMLVCLVLFLLSSACISILISQ